MSQHQTITSLDKLVDHVVATGVKKRIAVAYAQDPNTIGAIAKAVNLGFAEGIMIGDRAEIKKRCEEVNITPDIFKIEHETQWTGRR